MKPRKTETIQHTPHRELTEKQFVIIGFSPWKKFFLKWLPHRKAIWGPNHLNIVTFWIAWRWIILRRPSEVFVWSYKCPRFLKEFCDERNIPFTRVEDGFIRSVDLGIRHTVPLSLCFDRSGYMYFDANGPSDLETLIETHDFQSDPDLISKAKEGIATLLETRLSKYNISNDAEVFELYGPKTRKRILIIGQVDGDMSIRLGCDQPIDNNTFVRTVAEQNPDAQIIYKPHPEVLSGMRKDPPQSDPNKVRDIALVLDGDISIADAFDTVDEVHTITSLAGFEALIRGIPVHCHGMPFYAGWGVTTDRQVCTRRTARRSVEEIFAAAYILYPRYRNPETNEEIEFLEALKLLADMKAAGAKRSST
ncbi:capsular polysaccharide biosynthesis protein [uncultured Cohaesibacter sp.]|uniref:capsular polysaccharide export protein, LipB/KpsS family n=1 Tax=uncultured Cohaesibacter sp. TaxID=1002546 RepID=UPI0029C66986|nr:capsular polysaccharide biosynthesis protein [uncultured Cohaesibacter sp.]